MCCKRGASVRRREKGQPKWRGPSYWTGQDLLNVTLATPAATKSVDVRDRLVEALELDLVGPWPGHELENESLHRRDRPSTWYLAGFLVPRTAPPEEIADVDVDDDLATEAGPEGLGDE